MLTLERLQELFDYDPITGWFTNRSRRGCAKAGRRAGAHAHSGYRRLTIDYKRYYEHHLAWFYIYGQWPLGEMDHVDGNPGNNAITNLRLCNRSQNNCNAKRPTGQSGLRGAYLNKRNLQWFSQIQHGGQVKFLGTFGSPEEAHEAYETAAKNLHGEFYYEH
jgi:hypothetical protein